MKITESVLNICISLHTLNAGGGVQERRVMLANDWVNRGHNVTIVVPVLPKALIPNIDPKIKLISLGNWNDSERYHLIFSLPRLIKFFKRTKFDVIFSSTPQHLFLTSIALRISGNPAKHIVSIHGSLQAIGGGKEYAVSALSKIFLLLTKHFGKADIYFGVSRGVSQEVQRLLKNIPVSTIYNPVISGNESFLPEIKLKLKRELFGTVDYPIVTAVGRLEKQKGFDLLIEALSNINSNYRAYIIGEGRDRNKLQELINSYNLENKVFLIGYKSNVIEYIAASDCFVLSSRYEGFGNVLVEALFANTAIVSFACPHGPAEILERGKYGMLVDCYSIEQLTSKISSTLANPVYRPNDRWKDFTVSRVSIDYLNLVF